MPRRSEHEHEYERNFDATAVRYFSGRLSEPARAAFETWLQASPARAARLEQLRAVWEASADVPAESADDVEAALVRVKERVLQRRAATSPARPALRLELDPGRSVRRARAIWAIAAAVLIALGAGLLWQMSRRDAVTARQLAMSSYTTARGERAVVTLPDGSIVTLHNESALDVPRDFGGARRDVYLRGEAYFEVAHDLSRPFQVHGGATVTRVLGTKFDVRARPDERIVRVAVLEGRVAVGTHGIDARDPVLTPSQVAELGRDGTVMVRSGVEVRRLLGWTDGRLAFDGVPVPVVLADLSRWFDRDFALGDSAHAGLKLTTALSGQSLAEAVEVLEKALDARAAVSGRRIVLRRR